MINFFNLPDSSLNTQIFYANANDSVSWQQWQKPLNCNYVYILAIGGGGGGGSGRGHTTGNGAGGGGGGGASGFTYCLFQSFVLPDTLYIQVGSGGPGGAPVTGNTNGNPGSAGDISYVSVTPNTGANFLLLASGAAAAGGGGGGGSSSAGAAGTTGTIFNDSTSMFAGLGQIVLYEGQAGGPGAAASTPAINVSQRKLVTGGAGGGGTTLSLANAAAAGANVSGTGTFPTMTGGTGAITATGTYTDPSGAYAANIPSQNTSSRQVMMFMGGAGSGALNLASGTATGKAGAPGSYGCGGGGGGGVQSASPAVTTGGGGRGGDGIVIITWF